MIYYVNANAPREGPRGPGPGPCTATSSKQSLELSTALPPHSCLAVEAPSTCGVHALLPKINASPVPTARPETLARAALGYPACRVTSV